MKKYIYTVIAVLFSTGIFAQSFMDALRYSDHKLNGTARSAAMGNAFGALGGDFTSLSTNPAGLGVYRSGEFVLSFDVSNINVDGTYLGTTSSDSKYNFAVNNFGYVATMKPQAATESGLVSFSFGLGYNKLNNFSMNTLYENSNAPNSILTGFTNYVNSFLDDPNFNENDFDEYYEYLAWDTYLIDYDEENDEYFNDLTDAGYGQSQRKTIERKGYINEFVFSLGANFNHKFYLGATLGIHDVYYRERTDHYEYDKNNNIDYFNSLNFLTDLNTTGTGFNFKIGGIYKPTNELRLGLALHTPTFYNMRDEFYNTMLSDISLDIGNNFSSKSRTKNYDYNIETPLKAVFSAAYVIGKKALVSVDYEYVDYSKAKLKNGGTNGYSFSDENNEIKNIYKSVGNLRIGAEYRLNKITSLRAGYENYPSAFNSTFDGVNQPNSDAKYSSISAGFGLKYNSFFVDAAYKHIMSEAYETLYGGSNMAKYEVGNSNLIFTLGFKF